MQEHRQSKTTSEDIQTLIQGRMYTHTIAAMMSAIEAPQSNEKTQITQETAPSETFISMLPQIGMHFKQLPQASLASNKGSNMIKTPSQMSTVHTTRLKVLPDWVVRPSNLPTSDSMSSAFVSCWLFPGWLFPGSKCW